MDALVSDKADQSDEVGAGSGALEAHRAIAREFNTKAQKVYSRGGLIAIVAAALPIGLGWYTSRLTTAIPWVFAALLFLVSLYFVRARIKTHLARLYEELSHYCDVNALSPEALIGHYEARGEYPFFGAIREAAAASPDEKG